MARVRDPARRKSASYTQSFLLEGKIPEIEGKKKIKKKGTKKKRWTQSTRTCTHTLSAGGGGGFSRCWRGENRRGEGKALRVDEERDVLAIGDE